MRGVAVALLWRVVLLLLLVHTAYIEGYNHGVSDTEAYYENDDWSAEPDEETQI